MLASSVKRYNALYKEIKKFVSFNRGKLTKHQREKINRYHKVIYGFKDKKGIIHSGLINNGKNELKRVGRSKGRKIEIALRQQTSGLGQLKGAFAPVGTTVRFSTRSVSFEEKHGQFKVKYHLFDVNEWRREYEKNGIDYTDWITRKVSELTPEHEQSRFMIRNGENVLTSKGLMNQDACVHEIGTISEAYGGTSGQQSHATQDDIDYAEKMLEDKESQKDFPSRWLSSVLEYVPIGRGSDFSVKVATYVEAKKKRQNKEKSRIRARVRKLRNTK